MRLRLPVFAIPRRGPTVADLVGTTAFLYPRLTSGSPSKVLPEDPEFRMDSRDETRAWVPPAWSLDPLYDLQSDRYHSSLDQC